VSVDWLSRVLAGAALCVCVIAHAHDSWLSPASGEGAPGELALELATGSRYPLREFGSQAASVVRSRCVDADGAQRALAPVREQPKWLEMAVNVPRTGPAPLACWLELHESAIELEPRLVQVYLSEILASSDTREAWRALQARQIPWRERYRKYARIELVPAAPLTPGQWAALRQPVGLALEIVVLGDGPVAVGRTVSFQVLRDGQPLAGLPVELVSERSPLGVWRQTDAQGKLSHALPFGGRWLLRGTDLRLSTTQPGSWESRFVTLAIDAR
jgi:hypothetical protein